mmetsp:Transcript_5146/g.15395  ORF Transcript_5146/g.15395 Transcript_5146/m.15395 type:complete len:82 (-) Transcript_5146:1558-1803(-)
MSHLNVTTREQNEGTCPQLVKAFVSKQREETSSYAIRFGSATSAFEKMQPFTAREVATSRSPADLQICAATVSEEAQCSPR